MQRVVGVFRPLRHRHITSGSAAWRPSDSEVLARILAQARIVTIAKSAATACYITGASAAAPFQVQHSLPNDATSVIFRNFLFRNFLPNFLFLYWPKFFALQDSLLFNGRTPKRKPTSRRNITSCSAVWRRCAESPKN